MKKNIWLMCPVCGRKTRNKVREDTILINYPLFCPKCKRVTLVDVKQLDIIVVNDPDTETQKQ